MKWERDSQNENKITDTKCAQMHCNHLMESYAKE